CLHLATLGGKAMPAVAAASARQLASILNRGTSSATAMISWTARNSRPTGKNILRLLHWNRFRRLIALGRTGTGCVSVTQLSSSILRSLKLTGRQPVRTQVARHKDQPNPGVPT